MTCATISVAADSINETSTKAKVSATRTIAFEQSEVLVMMMSLNLLFAVRGGTEGGREGGIGRQTEMEKREREREAQRQRTRMQE